MTIFGLTLAGLPAGAAAAIALVGAAALTGLYLLKLRRRRVVVPFAPLWAAALGETQSERLSRRLRRWLSLALQMLFGALVLLAAVDPRPAEADRAGRSVLILIDRSASMSATDEPGSRLGSARRVARGIVAGLGPADRAMVATFASGVAAETGFEADVRSLEGAIDEVTGTEEPADLPRALGFAAAALRGRPHPTLILVSDGAYGANARAQAPAQALSGVDVRFAPVGTRGDNVAIISFAARRDPADRGSVQASVVVQSFRDGPCEVALEIGTVADGGAQEGPGSEGAAAEIVVVERARLGLAPGERKTHVLHEVAAPGARLVARLVRASGGGGGGDDLAVDDRTYAVVPALPRRRVLRVGGGNLFLEGALLSLGGQVVVRRVSMAAAESTRARWPDYDAVIFDGVAPAPAPTAGRFLYFDPAGAGSPFPARGALRDPVVSDTQKLHPLVKHVALADLNVREAQRLTIEPGDTAVASSFGSPLIVARVRPGLRVAALAFDPRHSDLPMRTAFPLLLANAVEWLASAGVDTDAADVATGGVSLRTGRTFRVGDADIPVARVGFHRVAMAGVAAGAPAGVVAANLSDPVESDTHPSAALTLAGRAWPRPPDAGPGGPRQDLWAVALIAAVALSLFEWWSYHRRWTV